MKCPTDGSVLVMSERSGVEIDCCPTCRGVWLDQGYHRKKKKEHWLSELFD